MEAAFTGTRFLVSVYAVHLQASPFVIGVLVALFSLVPAFVTVPMGRLIDRIGTRLPMQLSQALMCAALVVAVLRPVQVLRAW